MVNLKKKLGNDTARVVIPIILLYLFVLGAAYALVSPVLHRTLEEHAKEEARTAATLAIRVLEYYARRAEDGTYSTAAAQQQAIDAVSYLRYGDDDKNYIWIQTNEPRMVMHPYYPELDGQPLDDYRDSAGRALFADAVAVTRETGAGEIEYAWTYQDEDGEEEAKTAHVAAFEPWGWIVGTGFYGSDVQRTVMAVQQQLVLIGLAPMALATCLLVFAGRGALRLGTARQRADVALRESTRMQHTMFETAHDAIFLLNGIQVLDCNPSAERLLGTSRLEVINRPLTDYSLHQRTSADGPSTTLENLITAALRGQAQRFEWTLRRADGKLVETEIAMSAISLERGSLIQANVRDISGRKEAERQAQRLAVMVEQTAEQVIMTDTQGRILYANPAFERATGYSRLDATGQRYGDLLFDGGMGMLPAEVREAMDAARVWQGNLHTRRKDGTSFLAHVTVAPLLNKQDTTTGFAFLQRDVTRERELERQMEQRQRLESLGTLASGVAHDFNNLLTGILGHAQLAHDYLADTARAQKSLGKIQRAGERAGELIRQILLFSGGKARDLNLQDTALPAPVVRECLALLGETIPSALRIEHELDDACTPVNCASLELHQVVMNLCTNAAHAMPNGGVLRVKLAMRDVSEDRADAHLDMRSGRWVCLEVADTGQGMDEETRLRIFEPYFTARSTQDGTGLGLATVHGIVQGCGGHIHVYSEPGRGTVFRVYWPQSQEAAGQRRGEALTPAQGTGQHVLLIDDEAEIVAAGQTLLEHRGFRVTAFVHAQDALNALHETPEEFDVVVTDRTMPLVSGIQVAQAVQAHAPNLPVLMMTGLPNEEAYETARRCGMAGLVPKPFSADELARAVLAALEPSAARA